MTRKLFFFFVSVLLTSCAVSPAEIPTATSQPTSLPTQTQAPVATSAIKSTSTPILTTTSTQILPSPTPDICNPAQWHEIEIYILSTDQYNALGPGGPNTFDRILIDKNPDWADFRQKIEDMDGELWTAGQIFDSFAWGYELGTGVNPAVILVTYGIEYEWELPIEVDLSVLVDQIRGSLYQHELEWVLAKVDRSQYPPITNGASYSLYRYFEGDEQKLESWCRAYFEVYDESPVKTSEN